MQARARSQPIRTFARLGVATPSAAAVAKYARRPFLTKVVRERQAFAQRPDQNGPDASMITTTCDAVYEAVRGRILALNPLGCIES